MIKKPTDLIARAKTELACITPMRAKEQMQAPGAVLIDVREPEEVAASPVKGAVNIPRGVLEMKIESVVPQHDQTIMVCCATGGRAALSAKTLQEMGYTSVHLLDCPHGEIAAVFNT